jgi:hypothetical protein
MTDSPTTWILIASYSITLGLFVWLLYDVRKDNRRREEEFKVERQQLISITQQFATQMPMMTAALQKIQEKLG